MFALTKANKSFGLASHARQIKKALNALGYYAPYAKTGITGVPDRAMFDALRRFQKDQGLNASGRIKPGDATEAALNAAPAPEGKYIWRTVGDDKVRPEHAALEGRTRDWSDSPDPGEDFNCRCWAEPINIGKDAINPVYPEAFLIPLFRAGKLYSLWRIWARETNKSWTLGKHKSATRWGNQLRNRNWTPEQITETIHKGKRLSAPNFVNPGNKATRYEYKGRFIVRDDVTKEILQISGDNFNPKQIGQ